MRKYLKMIRRGDIVIVALLMIGSFLPLGVFTYQQASAKGAERQAVVAVDGEVVKVFDLADDGQTESFLYRDEEGHENLIVRTGTTIDITEANCLDQVCVRMLAIDDPGETIVCLPHKLLVKVTSDEPVQDSNAVDIIS